MNWNKIKTVLILLLIVINILLIYTLYFNKDVEKDTRIDGELVNKILLKNKIKLNANKEIKNDVKRIYLKLEEYDKERVKKVLEGFDVDSRIIDYSVERELEEIKLDNNSIVDNCYRLLNELNMKTDDIYIKSIGNSGNKTIVEFGQVYLDNIIKDSEMVFKYNNNNLLSFKRVWYNIDRSVNLDKDIYSSDYALYKVIGDIYKNNPNREREISIDNIRLIYLLDNNFYKDKYIIEGEASIYYEILTSDNKFYLINAVKE